VVIVTAPSAPCGPDPQTQEASLGRFARLCAPLDPDSSTYRTAILLLRACEVGQGVHKLARVTGYPREFVARCARRLVDNGVWRDGETVSPWTISEVEDAAFWADVGVAEGRLYRRTSPEGGLEWARPGEWWKEMQYTVSAGYAPATRYREASQPVPGDDSPRLFHEAEPEWAAPPEESRRTAPVESVRLPPRLLSTVATAHKVVFLGTASLAADVVWLS
jgi:hypothetical protein